MGPLSTRARSASFAWRTLSPKSRAAKQPRYRAESLEARLLLAAACDCDKLLDSALPKVSLRGDQIFPSGNPAYNFLGDRWSNSALTGGPTSVGQGIKLTWSIVPDGTALGSAKGEPNAGSDFIHDMNLIFQTPRAWLYVLQTWFDVWTQYTGVTYIYEPSDDGAAFKTSGGVPGVRGDIRIGAHHIDGAYDILAYNYSPTNGGDMVIDSDDILFGAFLEQDYGRTMFRNTLLHELGHGLGLDHVCPINDTKLMEPIASRYMDGAQFDDILAVQRLYGDRYEKGGNNSAATAGNLGTDPSGVNSWLSLSNTSDVDYYRFTLSGAKSVSIQIVPNGTTYLSGVQNPDSSCTGGTPFNAATQMDLQLQVLGSDGSTVLASSNVGGAGVAEGVNLNLSAGVSYLRVMPAPGAANNAQMYEIDFSITGNLPPTAVVGPIAPDPRLESVGSTKIFFNQPVSGFNLSDLQLTRDGFAVPLAGMTLTTSDNMTFTLENTTALTDRVGSYQLKIVAAGSGIFAPSSGLAMTTDAVDAWIMNAIQIVSGNNDVRLVRNGGNASLTDYYVQGVFQYSFLNTTPMHLAVFGTTGDDLLRLDFSGGPMLPSNYLNFYGDTQATTDNGDAIILTGEGNNIMDVGGNSIAINSSHITFSDMEQLVILGGSQSDDLSVGPMNLQKLIFQGRDGSDSMSINSAVLGSVAYLGGNGTDTLHVQGSNGDDTLGAASGQITNFLTGVAITTSSIEVYGFNFNDGNDNFSVSAGVGATLSINMGVGDDQVFFDPSIGVPVALDGLTGNDVLYYEGTDNPETFNISGVTIVANSIESIVAQGFGGNDTFNVASELGTPVHIDGGAATDAVFLEGTANDDTMSVTGANLQSSSGGVTTLVIPAVPNAFESIQVDGNNGNDALSMNVAVGIPVILTGGAGNDSFTTSNANLLFATVDGGTGADSLTFQGNPGPEGFLATATQVGGAASLITIAPNSIESLTINGNGGGDGYFVNATGTGMPLIINGSSSNEILQMNGLNAATYPAHITFNGVGGNDEVNLDDTASLGGNTFTINASTVSKDNGFGGLTYSANVATMRLYDGTTSTGGTGYQIDNTPQSMQLYIYGGNLPDIYNVVGTGTGSFVNLMDNPGGDWLLINTDNSVGGASVRQGGAVLSLGVLSIGNYGSLQLDSGGGKVLRVPAAPQVNTLGRIDLYDNSMIVDYAGASPVAAVGDLLFRGYFNGFWSGYGIASTIAAITPHRALGFVEATDIGSPPTFAGQPIDNTSILIRFTIPGDTNLDRKVDVTDLGNLATNWQQTSRRWFHGDFNYDQQVDVTDLGTLATHWQQSLPGPGAPFSKMPVLAQFGEPKRSLVTDAGLE
jgi:hypothetical protein